MTKCLHDNYELLTIHVVPDFDDCICEYVCIDCDAVWSD